MADSKPRTVTAEQRAKFKQLFYSPDLPAKFDAMRKLLQEYSGVPAEEVDDHVRRIRDKGWDVLPFPCIGQFRFLELEHTLNNPRWIAAKDRLCAPDSTDVLLDVGCFVGQAVRALVAFGGVDPSRVYGTDLQKPYLDLGYDLFRDEDKIPRSHFVTGDMLEEPGDPDLDIFKGKMTLIHASSFFHLFEVPHQVVAGQRVVDFLKPDAKDVMIFGGMVGCKTADYVRGPGTSKLYMHNAESWRQLWQEIGEKTGIKWRTEFEFIDDEPFTKDNPQYAEAGVGRVRFGVYRD